MTNKQKKITELALSQVGNKETGTNITKYAKDLDNPKYFCTKKQGLPWCAVFVCWLFVQICLGNYDKAHAALYQPKSADNLAAVCSYFANYFKKKNKWDKNPEIGAPIFFLVKNKKGKLEIGHVGIVIDFTATTVITVEGNKGNAVKKCSYKRTDSSIAGYGHPDWSFIPEPEPAPIPPEPTPPKEEVMVENLIVVKKGVKGEQVKTVQRILKQMGYYTMSIDGSCGDGTVSAIKKFQKSKGLTQDGSCGQKTWDKLLKG